MTGLYLAAAIETKDFEKEMNGLGYPYITIFLVNDLRYYWF